MTKIKPSVEIIDVEQGSDLWFAAKLGIISASNFHKVMAGGEGKVRTRYMRDLAGELLTALPAETFQNGAMQRGKDMEAEAREYYARTKFVELLRVGFVKNVGLIHGTVVGASPDSLIGEDGGLEIKTMIPALMIEQIEKGSALPSEHRAQVQGNMWVCERYWWDFKLYYPGMPDYTVRVTRDDGYIAEIKSAVEKFSSELQSLVDRLRRLSAPKLKVAGK